MKKALVIGTLIAVLLTALGLAGYAYAQTPNPSTPQTPWGRGMMGPGGMMGRGGMMGQRGRAGQGSMHEYMEAAMAEAMGVKVEDLEAALDSGKTMWQFAQEKGFTADQFKSIMLDARQKAIDKMVADGVITKEQDTWMLNHMQNMWGQGQNGDFSGGCPGMGGGWNSPANPPASNPSGVNF